MIAIDTNILVYAHRQDSQFHAASKQVVIGIAEGEDRWALLWPCVHEFLAIVTHPKIYRPASSLEAAFRQVEAWLSSPTVEVLSEGEDYLSELKNVTISSSTVGARLHDARIAALCLSHGVTTLYSHDRDFSRFSDLRVKNPL